MPGASDAGEFRGNRVLVTGETKGRLSPAAEKFWQCAKEAASPAARPKALDTRR